MRIRIASLVFAGIVAGLLNFSVVAADPEIPPSRPGPTVTISPAESHAEIQFATEDGPVGLAIDSGSNGNEQSRLSSYSRGCTATVNDPIGGLWSLSVSSVFQYDYSTVLSQSNPSVSSQNIWPYSWSNKSAWNTTWSSTIRFADGQGDLSTGTPPIFSTTWRVYIQEDAWGNCTAGAYRP